MSVTRILLTNDDGVHAEGLRIARDLLRKWGEVIVVAPDREMSGASHALTLNRPLRLDRVGDDTYVVNGTPTDCVNLALNRLLEKQRPDLVFSGINRGSNIGLDVTYSGTIAAAYEGALQGVKAMAVSMEATGDLERSAVRDVLATLFERLLAAREPHLCLNVNFPAGEIRGIRLAVQGGSGFVSEIIEKRDPRGRSYFWIGGQHVHESPEAPDSDIAVMRQGFVAVTPLALDLTHHETLYRLRQQWRDGEEP